MCKVPLVVLALVVAGCGGEDQPPPEAPEIAEIRTRGLTCTSQSGLVLFAFAPGQFGPTIEADAPPGLGPPATTWIPERGDILLDPPAPNESGTRWIAITNKSTREIGWMMLVEDGGGAGPCTIPPG